jgi:quinol monooxygenase YgiN
MGPAYYVSFRANLKNYDDEIDKFFDWVAPHVRDSGAEKTFLGYSQYEENDEPRLYYKEALA